MKILIVDDEAMMLDLLAIVLKDNHTVLLGSNGKEAVRMAKEHQPDLILLDVMMPEMNGFDALERIKADPSTSHLPVVLMSAGHARAQDMKRGQELGAVDYLQKPFPIFTVPHKLREWVT